jgi:hypothetical protein
LPVSATGVRVTLNGLTTNLADNIDVLLVDPTLTRKYVLVGDTGGASALPNAVLTFEDIASVHLPDKTAIVNGQNYLPTVCASPVSVFTGAPALPYSEPGCTTTGVTLNTAFGGSNPNGTWTLYIRDDNGAAGLGESTSLAGWGIQFLSTTAAPVSLSGRVMTASGEGIRNTAITAHHPCGTCAMGTAPDTVTDPQLRVHGIERLRVVDASVMPDLVSAHINACVLMIAEKAADLIRGKRPLPAADDA